MVSSTLMHGWVLWVVGVLLVLAAVAGYLTRKGAQAPRNARWVANASYLTQLASFRRRLSIYKTGLAVVAGVALIAGIAGGVLLARPVDKQTLNEELATRDIVLCLDVSGSMIGYDTVIIDQFLDLVENFDGERIALAVWNQTARTVFPLTDDYTLVKEELQAARDVLDFDIDAYNNGSYDPAALDRLLAFLAGTEGGDPDSTSLIGDGLVSCTLLFDEADTDRSRSIILAGDNQLIGTPIFELQAAAEVATEKEIGLIGVYAGADTDTSSQEQKEFETAVTSQGGLFFPASDPGAVEVIIDRIQAQQAVDLGASPQVVITDRPATALTVLGLAFIVLVLAAWRLRS